VHINILVFFVKNITVFGWYFDTKKKNKDILLKKIYFTLTKKRYIIYLKSINFLYIPSQIQQIFLILSLTNNLHEKENGPNTSCLICFANKTRNHLLSL